MEIIAAGRSVWAAIHTRGVHYTQQQDGVSEQLIGTGRRRRDAAGTGMTGADWWWGSSCWGDAEVTEKMTDGLRLDAGSSSAQFVPPDKLNDSSVCTRSWMYSCIMLLFNSGAFFFTLKSSIRNLFCFGTFKGIVSVCLLDEAAVPRKITASVVFPQKCLKPTNVYGQVRKPRSCCSDYDSYLSGGSGLMLLTCRSEWVSKM